MSFDIFDGTALVTGGAGFIGSHLVSLLNDRGVNVRVVDDGSRGDFARIDGLSNVEIVEGDLTDPAVARAAVDEVAYCFHLAAVVGDVDTLSNPGMMYENLVIDYNVLQACEEANVEKLFYTSSACVYPTDLQEEDYECLSEGDAFKGGANPDGDYGWAKALGEQMAKSFDRECEFETVIGRPFNPYGPHESFDPQDSHVIPAFIRRAVNGEDPFTVWGSGEQIRTFTYVEDLTEGMIATMETLGDGTAVNLSGTKDIRIADLAETVLDVVGHDVDIAYDESKPEGVRARKPDMTQGYDALDWRSETSLEEGIERTLNWYLEQTKGI